MPSKKTPLCGEWFVREDKVRSLAGRVPRGPALESATARFKALSHPGRLTLLSVLAEEECCVCELTRVLNRPFSTVSQHLRLLRESGLVRSRQVGKRVYYSVAKQRGCEILRAVGLPVPPNRSSRRET